MSAYLYTALVWRRLSDKCTNLTRNTQAKKSYEKLAFKVNGMAFFLLIVILPLYIYGNMKYPPLVRNCKDEDQRSDELNTCFVVASLLVK